MSAAEAIVIVSGLPRSGTSMMMKILEAGGLDVVTDHVRTADVDNPQGYYELERVKQIDRDTAWLPDARGKAFKMVSLLLFKLPPTFRYKIIFMRRNLDEILASQAKMLARLGKPPGPPDEQMARIFSRHLAEVDAWLKAQTFLDVLSIHYPDVLRDAHATAGQVQDFLDLPLDLARMAGVVEPALHRNKA